MHRISNYLLLILPILIILTCPALAEEQPDYYKNYEELVKVVRLIKDKYVDDVELADLLAGAYRGMLQELDPYSQYITPDEMEDLRIETEGEFSGLGIEVIVQDGILTVITPMLGSPAFSAGVMAGDKIIHIEGEPAERISLREAIKRLRGAPGTKVTITVLHPGETAPKDITIERGVVHLRSVRGVEMLDDDKKIGYIAITSFQEDTPEEFDNAIEDLLQEGVIVSTKGRDKSQDHIYRAEKSGTYTNFPIVVLINKGSASAAEIVAGAIRDNNRGLLVGTTTFGKGSVQSLVPVEKGESAIKLTTAKYYTPSGKLIHNVGIAPDIVVELNTEETKNLQEYLSRLNNADSLKKDNDEVAPSEGKDYVDIQLQRALDVLRNEQLLYTKLLSNPAL
ncbi:MAG: S41 family peptidase [Candidatus Brocadiales bacterium]|nr:S41 family peptidase [Candidatus Brocadiales bacterium]